MFERARDHFPALTNRPAHRFAGLSGRILLTLIRQLRNLSLIGPGLHWFRGRSLNRLQHFELCVFQRDGHFRKFPMALRPALGTTFIEPHLVGACAYSGFQVVRHGAMSQMIFGIASARSKTGSSSKSSTSVSSSAARRAASSVPLNPSVVSLAPIPGWCAPVTSLRGTAPTGCATWNLESEAASAPRLCSRPAIPARAGLSVSSTSAL